MLRSELETLKEELDLVLQENHTLQTKVDELENQVSTIDGGIDLLTLYETVNNNTQSIVANSAKITTNTNDLIENNNQTSTTTLKNNTSPITIIIIRRRGNTNPRERLSKND